MFILQIHRKEVPLALMLHSGDVIVMGGCSRTYVHGVPRIISGSFDCSRIDESESFASSSEDITKALPGPKSFPSIKTGDGFQAVVKYMRGRRINISIRQVRSLEVISS